MVLYFRRGDFLDLLIFIMFSRFGDIKLGPDHAAPEYSTGSWVAMLFSAGMGIGLMFYGVAEPIMHLNDLIRAQAAR